MKKIFITAAVVAAFIAPAQARYICGKTAMRLTHTTCGTPLARDWARLCPHTSAHAGAVVVFARRGMDSTGHHRGGHVALIVGSVNGCEARVRDERGTYLRDICRNRIAVVDPRG